MKYFENIQSFDDLKAQYRNLAKANHPDVGGDIVSMQEINAEYEILFPIYKSKFVKETGNECEETAQSTRFQFYTQCGWAGDNYDRNLTTKDIAERIRAYVKEAYPTYKFSVTTKYFSGGSEISVYLMEAPEEIFVKMPSRGEKYIQVHSMRENYDELSPLANEILRDVHRFANSYRYNDSDGMIDYFDTNFYFDMAVGKWDRPFKVVPRTARIKSAESGIDKKTIDDQPGILTLENLNLEIIDYSEKAIAVFGDTKPIKEKLSDLGGKFNNYLNYRGEKKPGWIFSKKKEVELKRELNLVG